VRAGAEEAYPDHYAAYLGGATLVLNRWTTSYM
jgi:hypothetical protein